MKPTRYLLGALLALALLGPLGASDTPGAGDPDADPSLAALGDPPIPADNLQSPAKVELGKLLFFDTRIGGDASIACADCHNPKDGWADPGEVSRGYPGTIHWRNSQSVINSAYYGKLFWAGASNSLEAQARSAASGGVAGNGEDDVMEARLALIPEYRRRFREVFGDEWPKITNVWRAIAAFERTLVHTDTPFDRFMRGDPGALGEAQKRGLALFRGKANCAECHNGPLLSDEKYYNLGVPPHPGWAEDGLKQVTFRFELYSKGLPEELYRTGKDDLGLYFRTKEPADLGKFRTPGLRYTRYTAPYMHNGALFTLEDVVDFYDQGGGQPRHGTRTPILKPLNLSREEKSDLVAFLGALSGNEIAMTTPELPPYAPLGTAQR
ncbi:MAG: cytochrome-c peroxidase [Candidatus Lambdaproteobacteria bacterium]|nr:cytochrome-c peroxidase [Candidatus Lambdaproteobacteria bacterium]